MLYWRPWSIVYLYNLLFFTIAKTEDKQNVGAFNGTNIFYANCTAGCGNYDDNGNSIGLRLIIERRHQEVLMLPPHRSQFPRLPTASPAAPSNLSKKNAWVRVIGLHHIHVENTRFACQKNLKKYKKSSCINLTHNIYCNSLQKWRRSGKLLSYQVISAEHVLTR